MFSFLGALAILIIGYLLYGKWVDRHFGANPDRTTPAYTLEDGVDFVPLTWQRIFLIQFLNIAGLGRFLGPSWARCTVRLLFCGSLLVVFSVALFTITSQACSQCATRDNPFRKLSGTILVKARAKSCGPSQLFC